MNIGKNAHFIFRQHVRKKKLTDVLLPKIFFNPVGAISYFVCGTAFETRIYIQNYFPLLTDSSDAGAKWSVDIFSASGNKIETKTGTLHGSAGAVITLSDEKKYGAFGILWVKIAFDDKEYTASKPFGTIFFTELTRRTKGRTHKILMHSLGFPTASFYEYDRTSTGLMLPEDSTPNLLYANGSQLRGSSASMSLAVINAKRESLSLTLPNIETSLGANKVNLFDIEPHLGAHIGNEPFSIRMSGTNILGKPLIIMEGAETFKGDHL